MATVPRTNKDVVRFGPFQLQLESGELRKFGIRLKISGQPIEILAILLERPGELVRREELRDRLWSSDTFVDFEHSLNAAIKRLRQALDDDVSSPRYIETVPRKGYRFIGEPLPPQPDFTKIHPLGEERTPSRRQSDRLSRRLLVPGLIVLSVLSVALLVALARSHSVDVRANRLLELQKLKETPLATLPGYAVSPSFSPDGSQVAFAWDGGDLGGGLDLYVKSIGADAPLRLTHTPALSLSVAWSPDGQQLAISRVAEGDATGVFLISPTGGPERKLISRKPVYFFGNELSWSPDGKYLAYVDHDPKQLPTSSLQVRLLSLSSLDSTTVSNNCSEATTPAFSPNGQVLAWVCSDSSSDRYSIRLSNLESKTTKDLITRRTYICGIGWSQAGDRIIYSGSSGELSEIATSGKDQPLKIPVGSDAFDLTTLPKASKVAYARGIERESIFRVDLNAKFPHAVRVVTSSRSQRSPSISPDGKHIAFESDRTGNMEVWASDADGSNSVQLTSCGTELTGTPRWSPDGAHLAFDSRVSGTAEIYVLDSTAGGAARRLMLSIHNNSLPSWSADGKWIYFNHEDQAGISIWKAPASGGAAIPVISSPATFAHESPDGTKLYFYRDRKIWQADPDGANAQRIDGIPELHFLEDQWQPAANGIFYIGRNRGRVAIDFYDVATHKTREVLPLDSDLREWIGGMAVSPDGRSLFLPLVELRSSDLMMIENWR